MKKLNFLLFAALVAIIMSSCKKDEVIPVIIEDGYYVTGTASPYTEALSSKALLKNGSVEGANYSVAERIGMFEGFVYLKPGVALITQKFGTVQTTWGIEKAGKKTFDGTSDRINAVVDTAKVVQGGAVGITVTTEGLYHIVMDKTTKAFMLIPVKNWNIIGGATPAGWSDTELTKKSLNAEGGEWEITGLKLKNDKIKFRYDKGWKVPMNLDVNVFTNVSSLNDATKLTLGATDFPFAQGLGIYTVNLKWNPIKGYSATFTKTGTVAIPDPSAYTWGIIGEAVGGWSADYKALTKTGNVGYKYTYKATGVVMVAGQFKLRRDGAWDNTIGGTSSGLTVVGPVTAGSDNFIATTPGTYTVTLVYDYENDTKVVTVAL